jgi:hypothetical protein
MARGTWPGNAPGRPNGPSEGLVLIVVAAMVVIGLVEWVIARIWWIPGGTVLLVALAVAGVL